MTSLLATMTHPFISNSSATKVQQISCPRRPPLMSSTERYRNAQRIVDEATKCGFGSRALRGSIEQQCCRFCWTQLQCKATILEKVGAVQRDDGRRSKTAAKRTLRERWYIFLDDFMKGVGNGLIDDPLFCRRDMIRFQYNGGI